jgi:DNA-binding NarL/FixJ family response regulator
MIFDPGYFLCNNSEKIYAQAVKMQRNSRSIIADPLWKGARRTRARSNQAVATIIRMQHLHREPQNKVALRDLFNPFIQRPLIMIRIVIADDHTIMREGLKRILEGAEDIEVVGEAVDGFEALAHVRKGDFDLLMLDLSMPGRSGVELIKQIKDEMPKLPILVLTMHEEEQYAVRAIRAGARGYLTKESAGTQLVSAIKKVASGRPYISLEVAEQLAMDAMTTSEDLPHKQLSDREFEVFSLLVNGKSITEIAELLHVSVKTVSTHKTRILNKMAMPSLADLVQYAVAHRLLTPYKR